MKFSETAQVFNLYISFYYKILPNSSVNFLNIHCKFNAKHGIIITMLIFIVTIGYT
jgi:hypothetical protein